MFATYQCSFFHQGWAQIQHCRCTESFPLCSHSGRCDTSLHSQCTRQCLKIPGRHYLLLSISFCRNIHVIWVTYTCRKSWSKILITDRMVRLTNTGLFSRGSLVPLVALAVVWSRCVDTVSIDTWVTHTFIHICTEDNRKMLSYPRGINGFSHQSQSRLNVSRYPPSASVSTYFKFLKLAEDGSTVYAINWGTVTYLLHLYC